MIMSSQNVRLNPGQEKIVEVQVNSSAVVNGANVRFYVSRTDNKN